MRNLQIKGINISTIYPISAMKRATGLLFDPNFQTIKLFIFVEPDENI